MSDPFAIRSYQKGNESQILELFNISYNGRHMSLPYWRWRFCDNPSGHGVIKMCWDHDMLAAHYAVTSILMSIEGRDYLSGLSGTTMTHPAYRGRKLFPILAKRTYSEMVRLEMAMVWGFPNAMSHRVFVYDLGWQDIFEIPYLRLQLMSPGIASAVVPDCVCEVFDADDRFDQLWNKVQNDYDIIVRRDCAYINWRYLSNPNQKYRLIAHEENEEIKGFAVFKRYQDELQVIDLLIGKKAVDVGENLMAYIITQALRENARSVSLWLNVTHPLHHVLEKIGFMSEGPVTYWGGLALNPQLDFSLYDFRRWYFMMGDSDRF